jgi:diguanylate cyclase (GGDEF)-like protein
LKHSVRFAVLGAATGVVVPLGLLVYALFVDREIDPLQLFLVLLTGGIVGLGSLGWVLGKKEDQLGAQNLALRALSDRLAALSTTDPLTGIPNRRALDDHLADELARARRYNTPLAVVMLDLDHFKRLNDRHGHAAGDAVLRHVAHILDAEKRRGDTIARFGGEEFVAILSHADETAAQGWAERVRGRLGASAVDMAGTMLRVTASFGVAAALPGDAGVAGGEALLASADHALYAAKARGRNRVVGAPAGPTPRPKSRAETARRLRPKPGPAAWRWGSPRGRRFYSRQRL